MVAPAIPACVAAVQDRAGNPVDISETKIVSLAGRAGESPRHRPLLQDVHCPSPASVMAARPSSAWAFCNAGSSVYAPHGCANGADGSITVGAPIWADRLDAQAPRWVTMPSSRVPADRYGCALKCDPGPSPGLRSLSLPGAPPELRVAQAASAHATHHRPAAGTPWGFVQRPYADLEPERRLYYLP